MAETRHVYIFALQGHLLDDLRREISASLASTTGDYRPRINVHDAVHGIARVELVNFRESAVLLPFWSFQIELGGITSCQVELINNSTNHHSIMQPADTNSKIFEFDVDSLEMDGVIIDEAHRLINLSNVNHDAKFYLRLPVLLSPYSVDVRVRCKLITSESWSEWTDTQSINIPSTLITKEFEADQDVLFVPEHTNHSIAGKVRQIIDADKQLYQIVAGSYLRQRLFNDVHSSRIYVNGPRLQYLVIDMDKRKHVQIQKTLLFGTHAFDEYDEIFNLLAEIYEEYADDLCTKFRSIQSIDYPHIGRYVANHVMDFLFNDAEQPEEAIEVRQDLLKCVLCQSRCFMRIVPIWHSSLVNHVQLLRYHRSMTVQVASAAEMNTKFSCDLCGIQISSYEWMFQCNGCGNLLDKHFICLVCGYHIIQQHAQIEYVLYEYLQEYLYPDCINLIVEFVCGSVISS